MLLMAYAYNKRINSVSKALTFTIVVVRNVICLVAVYIFFFKKDYMFRNDWKVYAAFCVMFVLNVSLWSINAYYNRYSVYWRPYIIQEVILHTCLFFQVFIQYLTWPKYLERFKKEFNMRVTVAQKLKNQEEIDEDNLHEELI